MRNPHGTRSFRTNWSGGYHISSFRARTTLSHDATRNLGPRGGNLEDPECSRKNNMEFRENQAGGRTRNRNLRISKRSRITAISKGGNNQLGSMILKGFVRLERLQGRNQFFCRRYIGSPLLVLKKNPYHESDRDLSLSV